MNTKTYLLIGLLAPMTLLGAFKETPNLNTPDINKLKLNQEVIISDVNGVINPKSVSLLQIGDYIRLCRPDGTIYTGRVTETVEEEGSLRIYGDINNVSDCQFGFAFAKGGFFAGAIIERKNDKIYALELSEAHKGFIFVYSAKYNKKLI